MRADAGDYPAAVAFVEEGLRHEPGEISLRAALAAYRARSQGSQADFAELVALAPSVDGGYRRTLILIASEGPGLPADAVAAARALIAG